MHKSTKSGKYHSTAARNKQTGPGPVAHTQHSIAYSCTLSLPSSHTLSPSVSLSNAQVHSTPTPLVSLLPPPGAAPCTPHLAWCVVGACARALPCHGSGAAAALPTTDASPRRSASQGRPRSTAQNRWGGVGWHSGSPMGGQAGARAPSTANDQTTLSSRNSTTGIMRQHPPAT